MFTVSRIKGPKPGHRGKRFEYAGSETAKVLMDQHWPGNDRELTLL